MGNAELSTILNHLCQKYPEFEALIQLQEGLDAVLRTSGMQELDFGYVLSYPPGHYHSPLPSATEVARLAPQIWGALPENLPGIDLNTRGQHRLFANFTKHYKELPYRDGERGDLRYHFDNNFFCYADAIFFYCMLREFSPRRLIEIGSGYSSCVALDFVDLGHPMNCTFIEPYPQRLHSLLRPDDYAHISIIEDFIQNVPLDIFMALEKNDILFIDSSHVGKIGSDVLFELFKILPLLKEGVIVHIHDIFYPFEYPREWVENNHWAWNENYFLRAFLQDNKTWRILFFNNYLCNMFPDMVRKWTPLAMKNTGGSLWLVKTGD
ncbi:MAG: class I SAM-dependent methyltransferase [Desulfovibrio sp.]